MSCYAIFLELIVVWLNLGHFLYQSNILKQNGGFHGFIVMFLKHMSLNRDKSKRERLTLYNRIENTDFGKQFLIKLYFDNEQELYLSTCAKNDYAGN